MGRIGDLGWAIRDRLSAAAVAVVLALGGLGAGVVGLVIALDAKDEADEAAASAAAPVTVPAAATSPGEDAGSAEVDELNERVAAIEESVSQLRSEGLETAAPEAAEEDEATGEEPTVPEAAELPEGVEVPGLNAPDAEP